MTILNLKLFYNVKYIKFIILFILINMKLLNKTIKLIFFHHNKICDKI